MGLSREGGFFRDVFTNRGQICLPTRQPTWAPRRLSPPPGSQSQEQWKWLMGGVSQKQNRQFCPHLSRHSVPLNAESDTLQGRGTHSAQLLPGSEVQRSWSCWVSAINLHFAEMPSPAETVLHTSHLEVATSLACWLESTPSTSLSSWTPCYRVLSSSVLCPGWICAFVAVLLNCRHSVVSSDRRASFSWKSFLACSMNHTIPDIPLASWDVAWSQLFSALDSELFATRILSLAWCFLALRSLCG